VPLHSDSLDTAEPFPGISQLELSNNLAENSMRPVALGRRNWIHIGSEQAGSRVAAIVSVVETLPTAQNSDPRVSLLDLARLGKLSHQSDRRAHAGLLAGSRLNLKDKTATDDDGQAQQQKAI